MTGINIVTKLFIIVAVIIVIVISPCTPAISDRRLCFDHQCSVPISMATTLMSYASNDPAIMSFKSNVEVTVYSKSAGSRQDLWGVEINGKRGYVPTSMLREKTVYKRTLIHDVSTEEIVANTPKDSTKEHEIKEEKNVPNKQAKTVDTPKSKVTEPAEKGNIISEESTLPTVPVLDQVSPSYEIHDGTTIPLAQNEEPAKPSYSTQIPQVIQNTEQQPILSIHPSIASTLTLKTGRIPIDESAYDAKKYLEVAGSLSEKIAVEATTELPNDPLAQDATLIDINYASETNHVESAANLDTKTGKATEEANVPSSQESAEKTMESNSAKLENVNNVKEFVKDTLNSEIKPDLTAAGLDNKIFNEVGDKAADFDKQIANDIGNEASEKTLPLDKIKTFETLSETATTELPENNDETEQINANSISSPDNNNNFLINTDAKVADNSGVVEHGRATEDVAEEGEESPSDDEESEDEDDEDDGNDEEDDLPEVDASKEEIKNSDPIQQQQPAIVEPVEAKPAEEVAPPSNLNIMNPLFSRLSMIPDVVKEIVANVLDDDQKTADNEDNADAGKTQYKNSQINENSESKRTVDFSTDNNYDFEYQNETNDSKPEVENVERASGKEEKPIAVESEAKHAVDNKISENTEASRPVDFSTDNNNANEYQNETDNSKPDAEYVKHDTVNKEVENFRDDKFVNSNNNVNLERSNDSTADSVETKMGQAFTVEEPVQPGIYKEDEIAGFRQDNIAIDETSSFNGFPTNRNLLNVGSGLQTDDREYDAQRMDDTSLKQQPEPAFNDAKLADKTVVDSSAIFQIEKPIEVSEAKSEIETTSESPSNEYVPEADGISASDYLPNREATFTESPDSCLLDSSCEKPEGEEGNNSANEEEDEEHIDEDEEITNSFKIGRNYWETLTYLVITALTTLLFSLGYYYIENTRRDGQLIAKINMLEKELLVASKECMVLDDTLKSTKTKLDSIEDESFGSNEMVASLKSDLEASKAARSELEDQVSMLEKELESATEAGLELERMLRELLSTNNQDNPLAQSVEDLQTRLNAQQAANEALTNALNLKAQENETLTADLASMTQKCEQLEVEVTRMTEELKHQNNMKSNLEQTLLDKVAQLEKQVKDISAERINLRKQLKGKEMELKDLLEVVNQMNISNLDFEKLYNVSQVKAEASQLLEERNELQIKLSEVEGAHQLLEEHMKIINEEVSSLSEQCKLAEKAKRDAETRVEVLSNFFKEKEAQRQKEEAVWLQKQGEVSSTVERLHTMQNEIHNYKQQIEMLKREILDQEREYKNQISSLETKSHEHWVIARQNERRLEESKAEAGQLRNRLTLIEKNLNDIDPEAKLHRLEANGETATSPQLFIGAEASSSPIMFTGSSGVPFPPPPSYLYGPPPPPFMPPPTHASPGIPPYEVGQRPPPLGGRLSSPPPLPGSGSGRYDNPLSPPPPLSPSMLPPFGPPHRAYPPPFANDRIHPPPPPPPHSSMLPPPPPLGASTQSWGNEPPPPPPLRNSGFRGHHQQQQQQQHQRDQQRARNHKGSLHSSGESLDKNV